MHRETDLLRVKLVAHILLDVQIQKTALSPVIVSHPLHILWNFRTSE